MISRRLVIRSAAVLGLGLASSTLIGSAFAAEPIKLRVAVTPGPHAEIMEVVKTVAAKKGLDITVVEFSDYVVPNAALDAGEIDANSFQHQPYLDNQVKDRGFRIVSVARTVNFPMGFYSHKFKAFADIPAGSSISVQNDPTNGGRALLLLQDKGYIKLNPAAGLKPSVIDIVDNPKGFKFIEIDAAQSPRALDDVAAAAINTNYATQAGLDPVKDPILREDPTGPYTNVIVVREADKDKPWVKELVDAYHSDEVKAFIAEKYKGAVLTAW